ncbi:acetylornithine deacetylase [Celeribacter neptunius]|uniref:Acetylornithine deacetylase n=1 Tax=Celeribacter neptunius TaxID=588602 RepID=A0A1I3L4C9_9RHOB|nr:acetylornithine deacetylase [Celeribacter neptunius]SFI79541.1 acetylornithine deacetylase [Celeribacter neptunius]
MDTLTLLDRLIAFDTTSARSNLPLIDFVEDYLRARGFRITRVPDATGQKAGLFAVLGPEGDGIMLSAHTDVVPVTGQNWSRDPFRLTREGDRLYGRGTTDMKGYLAAMLALADRAAKVPLKEPLKLAISYDEEVGCVGIQQMISALPAALGHPRACFVGEPTGMQVAIGHKGKAAFEAICHGESGHSALAPLFTNALHLAADFTTELRVLQDYYATEGARDPAYGVPYSTVHVGTLSGGTALNIVPDRAEMRFEYRHLAADAAEDIAARIYAAAARVTDRFATQCPVARIEVTEVNAYPGLDVPEEAEIVTLAKTLAKTNAVTKVAFGTEAGFFQGLGIATVVCGPGSMEGQGHKPDEYLELSELLACDAMMDRILDSLRA